MTVGFDIDCWMPIIVDELHIVWDRYIKEIFFPIKVFGDDVLIYESSEELKSTSFRKRVDMDISGVDQPFPSDEIFSQNLGRCHNRKRR